MSFSTGIGSRVGSSWLPQTSSVCYAHFLVSKNNSPWSLCLSGTVRTILWLMFHPCTLNTTLMFSPGLREGAGLGGYSTEFHTGRLFSKVQPLTLLYTIFDKNATPYIYLPLTNDICFTYLHVA